MELPAAARNAGSDQLEIGTLHFVESGVRVSCSIGAACAPAVQFMIEARVGAKKLVDRQGAVPAQQSSGTLSAPSVGSLSEYPDEAAAVKCKSYLGQSGTLRSTLIWGALLVPMTGS